MDYLELPKPLTWSVHYESTGFYVLFIKTTVPLQKPVFFPINLHFVCVCTCLAKRVRSYILICLVCRHSHWRWNEVNIKDQDEKVTNPCQLISIKGQGQGSGFAQKSSSGKMQSFIAIQPFLFLSWEMTIWTSSARFDQNLLISMPLGWWKHWDPNIFPYLSRIHTFTPY